MPDEEGGGVKAGGGGKAVVEPGPVPAGEHGANRSDLGGTGGGAEGGAPTEGGHEGGNAGDGPGGGGVGGGGDDEAGGGAGDGAGGVVDPGSLDADALRAELQRMQGLYRGEMVRATRAEAVEVRVKTELEEAHKLLEEAIESSGDVVAGALRKELEATRKELDDTRSQLMELQTYTDHIDEQFSALQLRLQEQGGLRSPSNPPAGGKVLKMIDDKNRTIDDLRAKVAHLESARAGARDDGGEGEEAGEIPFDVLDRLDDELASAREQLLHKDAELEAAKTSEAEARKELRDALEWKERAVQAQQAGSVSSSELKSMAMELDEERSMRRALEARFDEKLKLKVREVESLTSEVMRLKKAGEQLSPVLLELENTKLEARERLEQRDKELRRLQSSVAMSEADRQKAEGRVAAMQAEMSQWETKVKNSEEVRWRAGMNLAKAKAEMDWRMKADQEKDFFLERMKDELERLKNKLMRVEMRKLKVEESLEEAVLELRSKKREMEHMKARVEGLVRAVQQHQLVRGPAAIMDADRERGRMKDELFPKGGGGF